MTKIAIHQMCSRIDPRINLELILTGVEQASNGGAAMYFAPEMSVLLDSNRKRAAESMTAEVSNAALKQIREAARTFNIWVHLGSMSVQLESSPPKYANRSYVIDSTGEIRVEYDKIHLFDVDLANGESWRELAAFRGGDSAKVCETPIGLLGLSICYDLRFPDLYSALAQMGAKTFVVPAAFTVPTGSAHWHVLLRARAIEHGCFVIAPAQSGAHEDGRKTFGHSLAIDPWGDVILDMGVEPGLALVEIDLSRVDDVRAQIPVHMNRREIVSGALGD